MGTSRALDPRTGRWVLDCDNCGAIGGVRRVKCPHGWCPASQLCAKCRPLGRLGHDGCAEAHAEFLATEAAIAAEPERHAKAAWGHWHTGTDDVLVVTHAGTWVLVPDADYGGYGHTLADTARPWTPESGVELPPGESKRVVLT